KDAEAQRTKLEDQKRQIQKSESLERMAAAIAHLFNNQLCVVLGNLEMTLNDMTENTVARQNLVNAMRAARRSSEISGLMLTYLGQNNSKLEPLDLSVTCRHYLAKLQATMPGGIVIETELPFPGPVVHANASQIQQILMHLITNGWEAIGKHAGRVTVATRSLAVSDIPKAHSCHTDWQGSAESYGLLEVTDTGCGMTEKEMGKIFDPFFSTKFTGRGLGLAVVTGLVKAWGGTVVVQSEIGKGSTFQIFLPLVADVIPRGIEMLPEALKFKTGDAVLLVEDEAMVRTTTEAMLKRLGFTVFVTADGNEAITLFREHQHVIQCLVIDLSMPGMDGWETLAALRRIQPGIPAILSSGYDELQAMSGDYAEIPQAFLHKPYDIDNLRNVLGKVLGGRNGKER
ncbi:MAG: response regulator, partial [Desulfobulbaceae bacterium]